MLTSVRSMERLRSTTDSLDAALSMAAKGYYCIPVVPGFKVSLVKWKQYQTEPPQADELRELFTDLQCNMAVLCGALIVVDCDARDVESFVLEHCGDTPYRCRTPSGGVHLGYRARADQILGNRTKIGGRPIDLRAAGGYALVPPSQNAAGLPYRWEREIPPLIELPHFRGEWTRETQPSIVLMPAIGGSATERVRRARAYLARVDGARAGERGHNRTFRAACALTQKFGLNFDEAWPLLAEWNLRCEPEWTLAELRHKLLDALKKAET